MSSGIVSHDMGSDFMPTGYMVIAVGINDDGTQSYRAARKDINIAEAYGLLTLNAGSLQSMWEDPDPDEDSI